MSGFDGTWLALREPADHAARDRAMIDRLVRAIEDESPASVVDIGCGTGSTLRALVGHLPTATRWTLLDHDPVLLEEARRQVGAREDVTFLQHDLSDIAGLPIDDVPVVTASALFDLCSQSFCAAFAERLAERRCVLYAALNYDGVMRWSVGHPLDAAVVADFNRHQRTDKGFGEALGPDACDCLAGHFGKHGYRIHMAKSPWRLGPADAALQEAFLTGFRQPLLEIGNLSTQEVETWLAFRLSAILQAGSLCEVGHTDLLALAG